MEIDTRRFTECVRIMYDDIDAIRNSNVVVHQEVLRFGFDFNHSLSLRINAFEEIHIFVAEQNVDSYAGKVVSCLLVHKRVPFSSGE